MIFLSKNEKKPRRRGFYHVGGGVWWSRAEFEKNFNGSGELFAYCWRVFLENFNGCADDVAACLDYIAAAAVNDENSRFYIYG